MKRKNNQGESDNQKDAKDRPKKTKNDADKEESLGEFSGTIQSTELNPETDESFNIEREVTQKKKVRTSYIWQHFDIRVDQKTEYAHCKYCPAMYVPCNTYSLREKILTFS